MPHRAHQHKRITKDGRHFGPGAVYHGGVLLASSAGTATVAVYDGLDTSGDLIDYFSAAASGRDRSWLDDGLILRRGLYVDVGDNVSAAAIFYEPDPRAPAQP